MSIEIQGEQNEPNILQFHEFLNNALMSRVDAAGAFVTAVQSNPAASLANGECGLWLEVGQDTATVKFTARTFNGSVKTGSLTLG